jgi:pantetheine-phosphate adenylyltransferase
MKAVVPGTFDPITLGHLDIIGRAAAMFDEVVVAIGVNVKKQTLFSLEQRIAWIKKATERMKNVSVDHYTGLTTTYCRSIQSNHLVRGLRNPTDFQFEQDIAQLNAKLKGIETICFIGKAELNPISSSIVREIMFSGGDPSSLIPSCVDWREAI